jgi:hypothetical protein
MLRNSVINKVIKELQYYEVDVEQSRLYSTVTQLQVQEQSLKDIESRLVRGE